ncbi:MAG: CCA tRNA nucleotidyltransferase [Lagierella massiliensis]|nr:CCA tRNA nucleotidyltransferase [Lagierella massiliensis]
MKLPSDVIYLLNKFKEHNFSAFPVGGCVRDSLLCLSPKDFDLTCDALPSEILEIFKDHKTITLGEKFGTIGVVLNNKIFEITTMRFEDNYLDNRHPEKISFTKNLKEDLSRRDFTINAMAYDYVKDEIIDPHGGLNDLNNHLIRTVGNPDDRFSEDALRILRAFRFSGQLNFKIEDGTLSSICKNSPLLKNIAGERIKDELDKILLYSSFESLRNLYNCNVFNILLPEVHAMFKTSQNNSYHVYNVGDHSLMAVSKVKEDIILKYVALFHDLGKVPTKTTGDDGVDHFYNHSEYSVELSEDILNRLRFSKKDKERILKLIKYHDTILNTKLRSIMKFVVDRQFSYEDFLFLVEMTKADIYAQNPLYLNRLEKLEEIISAYKRVYDGPHKLSDLKVNGLDMISLGYQNQGIKNILVYLLKQVIADPKINEKTKLLDIAEKIKDEISK